MVQISAHSVEMQSLIHCLQAATVATNAGVTNTEELFLISKTSKKLKSKKKPFKTR